MRFPLQRWAMFVSLANGVKESINQDKVFHIGGGYHVETNLHEDKVIFTLADYSPEDGTITGTAMLFSLDSRQFEQLLSAIPEVQFAVPELSIMIPCYRQEDHQNALGALLCYECNPYGY